MQKYVELAQEMGLAGAKLLGPDQVVFDPRAILKCHWGCEDYHKRTIKCGSRDLSPEQCQEMVRRYEHIILVHGHDARQVSKVVLALEAAAFQDGYYFAFGVRYCKLCKACAVDQGKDCVSPGKVRPCDQAMGIDVFRTARGAGLPIEVLQSKEEAQNRYGFVLIA